MGDLYVSGSFVSFQQLQEKYGLAKSDFFRYLQVRHFVRTHLGHPLQASQVSQRLHNGEECNFSYVHTLHTMPQTGRFLDSSVFIFLKCLQDYIKARSRSGSTGNLQNRQHQLLSYGLLCGKKTCSPPMEKDGDTTF